MNVWLKADSLFLSTSTSTFWCRSYNYDVFELLAKDDETGEINTVGSDSLKIVFGSDESGSISNVSCMMPDGSSRPALFSKMKSPEGVGFQQLNMKK